MTRHTLFSLNLWKAMGVFALMSGSPGFSQEANDPHDPVCPEYAGEALSKDSRLINDLIEAGSNMSALVGLSTSNAYMHQLVERHLDTLRAVREVIEATAKDDFKSVLRWHPKPSVEHTINRIELQAKLKTAVDSLQGEFINSSYQDTLFARLAQDSVKVNSLLKPFTCSYRHDLRIAMARNAEKLRRYEAKYGSRSARLNGLEAVLNFYVLQTIPPFRGNENGPSPYEFIVSYSTSYVSVYLPGQTQLAPEPMLGSVFELGLRRYNLTKGWGQSGLVSQFLKPAYWTAGLAISPERTGFFKSPFESGSRYGVFGSYGDIKVAWVGLNDSKNSEILLTRQFQFIPWVF